MNYSYLLSSTDNLQLIKIKVGDLLTLCYGIMAKSDNLLLELKRNVAETIKKLRCTYSQSAQKKAKVSACWQRRQQSRRLHSDSRCQQRATGFSKKDRFVTVSITHSNVERFPGPLSSFIALFLLKMLNVLFSHWFHWPIMS